MEAERVKEILSTLTSTYAAVSVVRSAPAAGVFSRIQGSIVYENTPMHVPVLDLFDLQEDVLTDERPCGQHQLLTLRRQLISVLNDADMTSSLVTLLSEEPTERLQFLAIVNSFLQRLVSTVQVNARTYSLTTLSQQGVSLQRGYLGMGTSLTWHGSPDARTNWVPVTQCRRHKFESDSSSDSECSSGGIEAKKQLQPTDLDQLMAQAVVSSYIHHNRHPEQNPLIPALAVSGVNGEMIAILYDCVNDILFQITPLTWLDMHTRQLVPPTVVLMWLILNHRLFLRTLSTEARSTLPTANLRCLFERAHALAHYERLTDYAVYDWPARTWNQRGLGLVPVMRLGTKRTAPEEGPGSPAT